MSGGSRRFRPAPGDRSPSIRTLAIERLEDRALLAAGLTAQYYDNADLTSLKLTRTDAAVDFDWGSASPDASLGADTFSVRWTGQVQTLYSEVYTFIVQADDGVRLWINRQLIIDRWLSGGAVEVCGQTPLAAGQSYDLKLEYYENTGSAAAHLRWSSASQTPEVLPAARLTSISSADDRGSIQQEIWSGLSGGTIAALTANAAYPNKPSARETLISFESLQANWADNYGQRVRGWLVPAASGSYVLAIAGDEQTELYLSSDADPAHKALIASSALPTAFRDFSAYASQQSAPLALAAGQKYYIEALHAEASGADYFSVGWQAPGATQITVIPGDVLVPYGVDSALPAQGSFLNTLAAAHPRLMATPERFAWLKQQIATAGQMQTWYNTLKSSADTILTQAVSQYTQDNRGTILDISRTVKDRVYKLALVYWMTGDTRYAERAWDELNAAANFSDWHPAHFLDTAEMTHAFAIGYDWLYDYWTPARRATLSNAIVTLGLNQSLTLYRNNSSWVSSSSNNWNLVCNGGMILGALAVADEQPTLVEELLAKAVPSVRAVMQHFTADNGGWYEGPGYWAYSTEYNSRMLAALESALGSDFALGETPGLSETAHFPLYMTGPTKLSFNFADAGAGNISGAQILYYARRFNRPTLAWYERTNGAASPMDLVWYDPRGGDAGAAALPTDVHFRGDPSSYSTQDVVTMRTDWNDTSASFVGFKAGKVGDSHGNLDAGSFVFDALGQRWAYDLGSDDYALPGYFGAQRWDYYRLRAEGNNTLVINPTAGVDQTVNALPKVLVDQANAERSLSIADLTSAYSGVSRVWRGISLDRRSGSLLVQDEIEASAPAELWWFMHVKLDASQVQISADGSSAVLTSGSSRLWVKIVDAPGAQLTLRDPTPLSTSPNPTGQNANAGYKKLAIHLQNVTNRRLAVWLVPLAAGENRPPILPTLTALATWNLGAGAQQWLGDVDGYTPGGAADAGVADAAWQMQVVSAVAQPAANLDAAADGQSVAFSFRFNVPAGQQVTAAKLRLGLRATGGVTTADRLYLDSVTRSYLYSELGWATVDATRTARSYDLAKQLALLQDGQLNVAVSQNTAVDWAALDVSYGPTGQFTTVTLSAAADAYVRDGAYASQDFGVGDLTTQSSTTAGSNQEAFLRFDLSGVSQAVTAAYLRLVPSGAGGVAENQLAWVSNDAWTESNLTWNTKPGSAGSVASWTPVAGLPDRIDVTALVQQELAGDKSLSLRIFSSVAGASYWTQYASRENSDVTLRPRLECTTFAAATDATLQVDGDRDQVAENDAMRIVADGQYVSVFVNNSGDVPDLRRDLTTLNQMVIRGLGGDDVISIDAGWANPIPVGGATIDGGAGGDTLDLLGGAAVTASASGLALDGVAVSNAGFESYRFSPGSLTVSGATLSLGPNGSLNALTDLTVSGGGTLDLGGLSTAAKVITLADGNLINGTLTGTTYTLQNGLVSANLSGAIGLTKNTTGKVTLSGSNTYTGTTAVYQGTLNVRSAAALGSGSAAVTISCDGATNRYSTLEFEGADFTISGKPLNTTGPGMGGIGALHNVSGNHTWVGNVTLTGGGGGSTYQSDAGTLTIVGDITANTTSRTLTLQGTGNGAINGAIQDGSTVNLPLSKKGSGLWTLGGNNLYTGTTTISAGTLRVNGALAGGAVAVNATGTLEGVGAVGGLVTVASTGHLAPGTVGTVGTLTLAALTLNSGSLLDFDLGGAGGSDQVIVSGILTLNGGKVNLTGGGGFGTGNYPLIDYVGTLGGTFSKLTLGTQPTGYKYQLVSNTANTSVDLAVTNAAPTVATAAWANPSLVLGMTSLLSVMGADDSGEGTLSYVWTATTLPGGAAAPTFSANGTNAAKSCTVTFSKAGAYGFTVTLTDLGGLTATSSVAVTVAQSLTSISVSPSVVNLYGGKSQQFNATGKDQFGDVLLSQPTFSWSTTAGAISSAGLYTAPTTDATASVTATSAAMSGSGTVFVTGLPRIVSWESIRTHAALVDVGLAIPDTNAFSEPRNGGVRRLWVTFDRAIAPASFGPSSVQIAGNNLAGTALNLSALTVSTSFRNGNTVGVIDFGANLPDQARYLVRLQGVTDPAGNAMLGDNDRIFTNLKGDSSGDLRTNVTDLSYIQSAVVNPINPAVLKQVRSDVNLDGRINATDLSVAWAMRNADARLIPDPTLIAGNLTATSSGWSASVAGLPSAAPLSALADSGLQSATSNRLAAAESGSTVGGNTMADLSQPIDSEPLAVSKSLSAGAVDAAIIALR